MSAAVMTSAAVITRTAAIDSFDRAANPERRGARLRLTRRGRVVLTTLASIPLVAAAAFFGLNAGGALASGTAVNTHLRYVTIQPGESLWRVAEKVAPSADPRDVITAIVSVNQLQSVDVTPGQRIAIPADY